MVHFAYESRTSVPSARGDGDVPGWGTDDSGVDDSGTPILHVDMDSFYASVEVNENPALRGLPVLVGGKSNRGVVTAATYEARTFGIKAGMPMSQARAKCPQAIVLPGRRDLYQAYSKRVFALLSRVTANVEPISIDEAFLDVAGARRRLGSPVQIARLLRQRVAAEIGLPASVGISSTKTVAKIASGKAKPDGIFLVSADASVRFLHSLPVKELPGVGSRTEEQLRLRGIDTIKDLAHADPAQLEKWVGQASAWQLHQVAWGKDDRKVGPRPREKSVSTERTFETNVTDRSLLDQYVLDASHQCAARLRDGGLVGWTVTVKLRDGRFKTITRSKTLQAPTDVARTIAQAAATLVHGQRIPVGGYRLVGVGVSGLAGPDDPVPMLLDHDPRERAAEVVMDQAKRRYGKGALRPASLLAPHARQPSPLGDPDTRPR